MNISTLHTVTEEFASILSEVTDGDLKQPTPCAGWTVGDLCWHVVRENANFGHGVSGMPVPFTATAEALDAEENVSARSLGGGYDTVYRASARYMEEAFAGIENTAQTRQVHGLPGERQVAELYEMQIADTLIHTWDLARSVEFDYTPEPEIARLVLERMSRLPDAARGEGRPFGAARTPSDTAGAGTLERIISLSGRDAAWQPGT